MVARVLGLVAKGFLEGSGCCIGVLSGYQSVRHIGCLSVARVFRVAVRV